jgi:hypothetical protein
VKTKYTITLALALAIVPGGPAAAKRAGFGKPVTPQVISQFEFSASDQKRSFTLPPHRSTVSGCEVHSHKQTLKGA